MHSHFFVLFPKGAGAEYILRLAPNYEYPNPSGPRVYKIPDFPFGSCGYFTSFDSCACLLTSS